mmetsp:Transcript_13759/g.28757  ORF Transcript_13759/g.28757 Transcript_13759/m.28757 type:complete len:226 (-) Transcript_13759:18-695(-)
MDFLCRHEHARGRQPLARPPGAAAGGGGAGGRHLAQARRLPSHRGSRPGPARARRLAIRCCPDAGPGEGNQRSNLCRRLFSWARARVGQPGSNLLPNGPAELPGGGVRVRRRGPQPDRRQRRPEHHGLLGLHAAAAAAAAPAGARESPDAAASSGAAGKWPGGSASCPAAFRHGKPTCECGSGDGRVPVRPARRGKGQRPECHIAVRGHRARIGARDGNDWTCEL